MTDSTLRTITVERTSSGHFTATNTRGGAITFAGGPAGDEVALTPVELLLAALGGCAAVDVDIASTRHSEPETFRINVTGQKVSDDTGNRMEGLQLAFDVIFPPGEMGDRARAILPRTVKLSHDKLCTVSRTVEAGTPVTTKINDR